MCMYVSKIIQIFVDIYLCAYIYRSMNRITFFLNYTTGVGVPECLKVVKNVRTNVVGSLGLSY